MHKELTQDEQSQQVMYISRLRDDNLSSSDDSTQPPNVVFETEFPDQMDSIDI